MYPKMGRLLQNRPVISVLIIEKSVDKKQYFEY